MPVSAIAARYGVTGGAVSYKLRNWGILSRQGGAGHRPGPQPKFCPPKEELERLYAAMSMRDIARHYGVGETVVFTRIKQAGLATISRSRRLTGKPKTPEHIANFKAGNKGRYDGPSNPNWRGGITPERVAGRTKPEYSAWREAVLQAAGHRCQRCGVENGSRCGCCGHTIKLHAHHPISYALHPERRYDPANGEALCEKCHHAEHHAQME